MADDTLVRVDKAARTDLVRAELAEARLKLTRSVEALKGDLHRLDVRARIKESIAKKPLLWLGGALAVGALLGKLSRRLF